MTQTEDGIDHLTAFPTEVLLYIFTFLPAVQLVKCREVCQRWRQIIDELARSDSLWYGFCQRDFSAVYEIARHNSRAGLLWFDVYKSIALWPRLSLAREDRDEFASASTVAEEIRNFTILEDGIIGVNKRYSIVYYDIETLEQSKHRGPIKGEYFNYTETDDALIIMNYHFHLFIIRKILTSPHSINNTTFYNVRLFIVAKRNIYFVDLENQIFICDLDDELLAARRINQMEGIMTLGIRNDVLYLLTYEREIFSLINNELALQCTLGPDMNLLHKLNEYNLLEHLDWRVCYQWIYILNQTIPQGPLQDIVTIRTYGDTYFIGTNWGVLRIYHKPYCNGQFDLSKSEPVKQYNFMERYDCPVLSMCPILQIDILEGIDKHTVLVAMPKKIAVLNFTHNFKRSVSVAMLPYGEVQKVKVLKIDEYN